MRQGLAVAGIALAAAGCVVGEDRLTRDELERVRLELSQGPGAEASDLYSELVVGDLAPEECIRKARRFHDVLGELVDDVDELRPPRDIEGLHREFVAAARETVGTIGELADDVAAGELSCGPEYNQLAYGLPSTGRAYAVLEELERRGYQVLGE